jgi:hypothetical protein
VRLRFFTALLIALFLNINTPHASSASTHGCAPPIPPSVPGSPAPAPTKPGILLINEVLSMPGSTWNCSELNKTFSISNDSWIELYNPQNQPFNLYAAHASFDTGPNTPVYYFPFGAAIATHGYLVLFPAVYSDTLIIGANLRFLIAGVTIDQVTVPTLPVDQSYARIPAGSNTWQVTNTPTIDASNMTSQVSPAPTSSSPNQEPGGYGNAVSTPTLVTGTQPAWSNLQLPAQVATFTPGVNSALITSPASPVPASDGWDTPRRILLTVLAVALALMLFWCWRLFSTL